MTDVAGVANLAPQAGPLEFDLKREPDGRSWTVRENLADVLERQLLGPMFSDDEALEDAPDTLYMVGRIAPVRLTTMADPVVGDDDDEIVDPLDARSSRGVPVAEGDEDGGVGDDDRDDSEDAAPRRGLMIPSSMGLRFQIPVTLDVFTVHGSWGTYKSFDTGKTTKADRPIRHFRRTPVDHSISIKVAELQEMVTRDYELEGEVLLRVDMMVDGERRLIEVALCNNRETPRKIPVDAWLYQTKLSVDAGGEAVFLPVRDVLEDPSPETDEERRRLALQYRDRLEFAHGRICSADWAEAEGTRRATAVWTTWLPTAETPQVQATEIDGALLDMTRLAIADVEELEAGLRPIIDSYEAWLISQDAVAATLPAHLSGDAADAIVLARKAAKQLRSGLEFLLSDEEALRCFRFMNSVMAEQRIGSQVAERRTADPSLNRAAARDEVLAKGPVAHSWRTFQIAFVLMQLEALTVPSLARRSGDVARVELLFFPTGGGKTEAYLGLAAYTFAIRRRQGIVETAGGLIDGRSGVAVLMRYTLRLLTSQQFQRATALVCAAELARLQEPEVWGDEPFRIGLWVGTDVSPKRVADAAKELEQANDRGGYRLTVLQVQRCPWCGEKIAPRNVRVDQDRARVYVYCGDQDAECPFAEGGAAGEGLPILTVDEEIYRLAPAFVIATVDKFARLAREGEAAALFGYVSRRCERHGYVHSDYQGCDVIDTHPARNGLPKAHVTPVTRLRPPDLIIQDELHLITGSLGTTVGLFEAAIDVLTTWGDAESKRVRPLIVASSATVRNAQEQVKALYGRGVTVFPPQVLDASNTFFSREVSASENSPGRRYIGVSATGVRLTAAEIRLSDVLMSGAQLMLDRSGKAADPYMTLVGYFNATRELAGMARFMGDDIQTALAKGRSWTGIPRRRGTDYGNLNLAELTSRIANRDITRTLDEMARTFDADFDTSQAKATNAALGKDAPRRSDNPFDVVLATSMLQVGVDVPRLGLMLVVGQPKNTAEYIQATSRVGRDDKRPGLVVTLGNWARPRDLTHFEQFRHYHETFYSQVEALSVTPYSITSMDRGIDGVLIAAARVIQATKRGGLSPELGAGRIETEYEAVKEVLGRIVERMRDAGGDPAANAAQARLNGGLDQWVKRRKALQAQQLNLAYERIREGKDGALMISPENRIAEDGSGVQPPFAVANSMREVQPEINLLVSPIAAKLFSPPPENAPGWQLAEGGAE